ncbi:HNH endonuclease [Gordonia sp. NPDC003950]
MSSTDPLTLGQRLVAVLEDGQRSTTYKLAVMVTLLDLAVELVTDDPDAAITVDLDLFAHRLMDMYWRQTRPLDGRILRQSNTGNSFILSETLKLRSAVASPSLREVPFDTAAADAPTIYHRSRLAIKKKLVELPLKLLQKAGTGPYECFLYDDSWLGHPSNAVIEAHGNCIELFPGVCHTLARLAPLVKPAFQLAWVADVRRMNKQLLLDEGPDLSHHLFGADRVSLQRPAHILGEHFGNECFYCHNHLRAHRHVDHVLPWSRVGIDGLSNLVLACPSCNSSKSDLLPDPDHVTRALDRGRDILDELAHMIHWPSQYERVASAAHGLYSTQPPSTPVWHTTKHVAPLGRIDFFWA